MPFKKGQSGNPGGRPKSSDEVKELAKKHTKESIDRLVFWLRSDNAKASVSAASALLDRAHGKPAQQIDVDATVRQTDVSADPLQPDAWDERYGQRVS